MKDASIRAGLGLALLLAGCGFDAEIVLVVRTDIDPAYQQSVEIAIAPDAEPDTVAARQRCVCLAPPCAADTTPGVLPLSASLRPGAQRDAPFRVVARGHVDAACDASSTIVESKARVHFVAGGTRELELFLSAACAGVSCAATETCDPSTGQCVDDSTELPPVDPQLDFSVPPQADAAVAQDLAAPPDLGYVPRTPITRLSVIDPDVPIYLAASSDGARYTVAWLGYDPSGLVGTSGTPAELGVVHADPDGVPDDTVQTAVPDGVGVGTGGMCALSAQGDTLVALAGSASKDGSGGVVIGLIENDSAFSTLIPATSKPQYLVCAGADQEAFVLDAVADDGSLETMLAVRAPRMDAMIGAIGDPAEALAVAARVSMFGANQGALAALRANAISVYSFDTDLGIGSVSKVLGAAGQAVALATMATTYLLVYQLGDGTGAGRTLTARALAAGVDLPIGALQGDLALGAVAVVPSGSGAIVAWLDGSELHYAALDASGALVGGVAPAAPLSTRAFRLALAAGAGGEALLAWIEELPLNGGGSSYLVNGVVLPVAAP